MGILFKINYKNLDPSYKLGIDFWACHKKDKGFWDCFGRGKLAYLKKYDKRHPHSHLNDLHFLFYVVVPILITMFPR